MKSEQKTIAAWMSQVLDDTGMSAEEWARLAGVSPTTVTRAMRSDYQFVTKRTTVEALAMAARVRPPSSVDTSLNGALLRTVLETVLRNSPKGQLDDQDVRELAEAAEYALRLLQDAGTDPPGQGEIAIAARAAIAQVSGRHSPT